MDSAHLGKWIIFAGLVLVAVGVVVWAVAKLGLPLGQLPGDVHVKGDRSSFYFPIVTCIVVSVVLTILLNIIGRFMR